jgi:hypothetical protein
LVVDVVRVNSGGSVIVALIESIQPAESVTVAVYAPSDNPVAVDESCDGVVFHEYTYGGGPPVAETVIVPSLPPKHDGSVASTILNTTAGGSTRITLSDAMQPLVSETDNIVVPAERPVPVTPVPPTGVQR